MINIFAKSKPAKKAKIRNRQKRKKTKNLENRNVKTNREDKEVKIKENKYKTKKKLQNNVKDRVEAKIRKKTEEIKKI